MRFKVVVFPGSNCDDDMVHLLSNVMKAQTDKLWHKERSIHDLKMTDCIILPGGFAYGDYLRSGAIARFAPIMNSVIKFANKGGLVFGICNGFQVLCEAGLLPGTLLRNINQKFLGKNVFIKRCHERIVNELVSNDDVLQVPIAHAEGRYFAPSNTIKELEDNNQIIFKYCNSDGMVTEQANPNGSLQNIAGICNKVGNVYGMMPHPERASENILGNNDGKIIFDSLLHNSMELAG